MCLRPICAAWMIFATVAAGAAAQTLKPTTVRFEAGSLNHGDLLRATFMVGGAIGVHVEPHGTVLLRLLRQSQEEGAAGVGRSSRTWVMATWENAYGTPQLYHRQTLFRLGFGVMVRPVLSPALVAGAGLGMRYPLARHWSLLANVEDDLALLPTDNPVICDSRGCLSYHFDGQLEHNIGLILSGEWSR